VADQSAIWALLPGRLAAYGFKTFRLAAGPAVIGAFIGRSLRETTGRWQLTSAGAEGSLVITDGARPAIVDRADEVTASLADGARLTLRRHDKVRIFGFSSREHAPQLDTVALVLPKGIAQRERSHFDVTVTPALERHTGQIFAEAWLKNASAGGAQPPPPRLVMRNALGAIETPDFQLSDEPVMPDANAPEGLRISKAFAACAVFEADDPGWLAEALAP